MKTRLSLVSAVAITALAVAVPGRTCRSRARRSAQARGSGGVLPLQRARRPRPPRERPPHPYVDAFERTPASVEALTSTIEDCPGRASPGGGSRDLVRHRALARGRTHADSAREARAESLAH